MTIEIDKIIFDEENLEFEDKYFIQETNEYWKISQILDHNTWDIDNNG